MSDKTFTGSYCLLFILLCCGILPGIVYYLIARKELGNTQQTISQTVIIQGNESKENKKFCANCGAVVKSKFCEKCGSEN